MSFNPPQNVSLESLSLGTALNLSDLSGILRSLIERLISALAPNHLSPVFKRLRRFQVDLGDEWVGPGSPSHAAPVWRSEVLTEERIRRLEETLVSNRITLAVLVSTRGRSYSDISYFENIFPRIHGQGLLCVEYTIRAYVHH